MVVADDDGKIQKIIPEPHGLRYWKTLAFLIPMAWIRLRTLAYK